jgi:hypothetical protein
MRQSAVIAGKKEGLSALQAQRSEKALRLKALGDAAPPPPIVVPLASSGIAAGAGGSAAGNTEAAQKLVEEIYVLIGSDKIDEAVGRFNSGQSFLLANVNAEAFQILKYAVDQAIEAKKKPVEKK